MIIIDNTSVNKSSTKLLQMYLSGVIADNQEYKIINNQLQELSDDLKSDTLNLESLETLMERVSEIMKNKELLKLHKTPISQLPNGRWYTRIDGKMIQLVKKENVEKKVIEYYSHKTVTIADIFPKYIEQRKKNVVSTTWTKELVYYDKLLKTSDIFRKPLDQITLDDGYDFADHCLTIKPNMTRKYWTNVKGSLNQIFQYAIDRDFLQRNPFDNMKLNKDFFTTPPKIQEEDTVFSEEEQNSIIALAEADAQRTRKAEPLGILILFHLALRDGELCSLKWGDILKKGKKSRIHIQRGLTGNIDEEVNKIRGYRTVDHCKTRAGDRILPLNQTAKDALREITKLNIANGIPVTDDDFIFIRTVKGEQKLCNTRVFDSRLRKYCKQAGMSVIKSQHDIRRTVLTNLHTKIGMPLRLIQHFAGHSSLKQTLEYIRISEDDDLSYDYLEALSDMTNIPEELSGQMDSFLENVNKC